MLGQLSGFAFEDTFRNELVKYWVIEFNTTVSQTSQKAQLARVFPR